MEFEPMGPEENDDFETELRQAFERKPAPPGMKARLMATRRARQGAADRVAAGRLERQIAECRDARGNRFFQRAAKAGAIRPRCDGQRDLG